MVRFAAVQTTTGSDPGALRRVGPRGASEPRGASGTLLPGPAHQEAAGQIQVLQLIQTLIQTKH